MTFSLLAFDKRTGALGGAAATGNLCVGGWVLRGDARAGLTASQGLAPSTLWGEDALEAMRGGLSAEDAVRRVTGDDKGRETRQLAALDRQGGTAGFDGSRNRPYCGHRHGNGWIAAGNWLASATVLDRAADILDARRQPLAERLLDALAEGVAAGSDSRGTLSAALLVVAPDRPPLSLRVDYDRQPVARLRALFRRSRERDYEDWVATLPTRDDPDRAP